MRSVEFVKIIARRLLHVSPVFSGDYPSWQAAKEKTFGYEADNILEKVRRSMEKVKRGEAVFERDSVIFNEVQYSWPLLGALMWIAAMNRSQLDVVDFGGSLGSSYFQNKYFLDTLDHVHWQVIEQQGFVEVGEREFADQRLGFSTSLENTVSSGRPQLLLIACTLPYLEDPYAFLRSATAMGIPYLLIDNTYFNFERRDRVCIQNVPPEIYKASYPCWFLDYDRVLAAISENYTIVSEHYNDSQIYLDGRKIRYRGLMAKIKTAE